MSSIIRFGLDLAKSSFAVCGVYAVERIKIRKTLSRSELLILFLQQPCAVVAMESGSAAHHWARSLRAMGHDRYLRTLLVRGARSEMTQTASKIDQKSRWA
jgi:transposase